MYTVLLCSMAVLLRLSTCTVDDCQCCDGDLAHVSQYRAAAGDVI